MKQFNSEKQIESIQVLRAVAAIAVVAAHIPVPIIGDGFWGVDLFFVISGFIMCYATEKSGQHFFSKRVIRIVPLYWVGTIGVFGVALVAPSLLNNSTANISHLIKSLLFIPFQKGQLVTPLLFQGWTLNYEMFFYLIFALSMRLNHRYRAVISSAIILTIVACGQLISTDSLIFKFFSKPILVEFVFGMFSFTLFTNTVEYRTRRNSAWSFKWILAGILILLYLPFATKFLPDADRVIQWGILSAISFFCILHGSSGVKFPKYMILLGNASYSLYLFHPYPIQFLLKVFNLGEIASKAYLAPIVVYPLVALCCGFGIVLYKYIEQPLTAYLQSLHRTLFAKPISPAHLNQKISG